MHRHQHPSALRLVCVMPAGCWSLEVLQTPPATSSPLSLAFVLQRSARLRLALPRAWPASFSCLRFLCLISLSHGHGGPSVPSVSVLPLSFLFSSPLGRLGARAHWLAPHHGRVIQGQSRTRRCSLSRRSVQAHAEGERSVATCFHAMRLITLYVLLDASGIWSTEARASFQTV